MKVVVTCEYHFDCTPEGRVWTDGQFASAFWTRYLTVFESVCVLSRMREAKHLPPGRQPADGPGISFHSVPDYLGLKQYLTRSLTVAAAVSKAPCDGAAIILRCPGNMASCLSRKLRGDRAHPYGVEVGGDPCEVFAPGVIAHPLRPVLRWWFTRELRRQCAGACAAAYVTERVLQRRYPPGRDAFSTHYSSIELPDSAFAPYPRGRRADGGAFRLVFVGSLAQVYKGPDLLIDAVAKCRQAGLNLELTLIGSGRHQPELEARAANHGLRGCLRFVGQLPTVAAIRAELDRADLFVMPSRTEGLPRAMIEAMARALPCIGTAVGGIPELLPAEDLVAPDRVTDLSRKIYEVLMDPGRAAAMSARNLKKAREYSDDALNPRRKAFYGHVKDSTETWLKHGRTHVRTDRIS